MNPVVIGDQYWKDWLGAFESQAEEGQLRSPVNSFLSSLGLSAREGTADPWAVFSRQLLNFNLLLQSESSCVGVTGSGPPARGYLDDRHALKASGPGCEGCHGLLVGSGV